MSDQTSPSSTAMVLLPSRPGYQESTRASRMRDSLTRHIPRAFRPHTRNGSRSASSPNPDRQHPNFSHPLRNPTDQPPPDATTSRNPAADVAAELLRAQRGPSGVRRRAFARQRPVTTFPTIPEAYEGDADDGASPFPSPITVGQARGRLRIMNGNASSVGSTPDLTGSDSPSSASSNPSSSSSTGGFAANAPPAPHPAAPPARSQSAPPSLPEDQPLEDEHSGQREGQAQDNENQRGQLVAHCSPAGHGFMQDVGFGSAPDISLTFPSSYSPSSSSSDDTTASSTQTLPHSSPASSQGSSTAPTAASTSPVAAPSVRTVYDTDYPSTSMLDRLENGEPTDLDAPDACIANFSPLIGARGDWIDGQYVLAQADQAALDAAPAYAPTNPTHYTPVTLSSDIANRTNRSVRWSPQQRAQWNYNVDTYAPDVDGNAIAVTVDNDGPPYFIERQSLGERTTTAAGRMWTRFVQVVVGVRERVSPRGHTPHF